MTLLAPASFHDALTRCTVDNLKHYLSLLLVVSPPLRKAELLDAVERCLDGEAALHSVLNRLDELQQLALGFAVHRHDGRFPEQAFKARYGGLPAFTLADAERRQQHAEKPNLLYLLFGAGSGVIPVDLCKRLRPLLPEPEPMRLLPLTTLPEQVAEQALTVRGCELEAAVDLLIALRLAESGKLQVGEKTGLASATTRSLLAEQLSGGDYYSVVPKTNSWNQEIGAIKGFAWPLILQAGKLVERQGKRLTLTAAGRSALAKPAESLRKLWQAWVKNAGFDEFSRIDDIKGQSRSGRVMTAVATRRMTVATALGQCPVGAWVEFGQLSRYMQAEGLGFEVSDNPWQLYIGDEKYGSLGYADSHGWEILQAR